MSLKNNYQLIDEQGNFNSSKLAQIIEQSHLRDSQGKYTIVSIFGPQNSGKSTLLNKVFGIPNIQSTRGIYISHDSENELIVLDVEGSTNATNPSQYLSQNARFAIAFSNIFIINYTPNSKSLECEYKVVKEIMETNVRIGSNDSFKHLLFVVRDFDSEAGDFKMIEENIFQDVYGIWDTIEKSESYSNTRPDGIFKIQVCKAANFTTQPIEFEADMKLIRNRFVDTSDKKYMPSDYIYRWNVPIDGLENYANLIWEKIQNQLSVVTAELKKQSQINRCSEIRLQSLESASIAIQELAAQSAAGYVKDFSSNAIKINEATTNQFYNAAKKYQMDIRSDEYKVLEKDLMLIFYPLFLEQVVHLKSKYILQAHKSIDWMKNFVRRDNSVATMQKEINDIKVDLHRQLINDMRNSIPFSRKWDDWEAKRLADEFIPELSEHLPTDDELQLIICLSQLDYPTKLQIDRLVSDSLDDLRGDFWNHLNESFKKICLEFEEKVKKEIENLNIKEESLAKELTQERNKKCEYLQKELKGKSHRISNNVVKLFRRLFLKDEAGVERQWKKLQDEEIKQILEDACKNAESVIEELKQFKLTLESSKATQENISDDSFPQLFEESVILELKDKIKQDSELQYNTVIQQRGKCIIF